MVFNIRYVIPGNEKSRPVQLTDTEIYTVKDTAYDKWYTELHSGVCTRGYSLFLLKNQERYEEIIDDFDNISELRGWLWEVSNTNHEWSDEKHNLAVDYVRSYLKEIINKYEGLYLNED